LPWSRASRQEELRERGVRAVPRLEHGSGRRARLGSDCDHRRAESSDVEARRGARERGAEPPQRVVGAAHLGKTHDQRGERIAIDPRVTGVVGRAIDLAESNPCRDQRALGRAPRSGGVEHRDCEELTRSIEITPMCERPSGLEDRGDLAARAGRPARGFVPLREHLVERVGTGRCEPRLVDGDPFQVRT
jgi:hypothetical protein